MKPRTLFLATAVTLAARAAFAQSAEPADVPLPPEEAPASDEPPPPAEPAPPPPPPAAPAPPPAVVVPPAAAAPAPEARPEPLAGVSDGTPFLRAPDNSFVLFPGARLQVDGYAFKSANKTPNRTFLLRSARLELGGWVGGWIYFFLSGEFAQSPPAGAAPVAPANLNTNDDWIALAPFGSLAVLQVGQFDAPFTLENRTSSKYIDFMERSITVRAFGFPDNKEMGAMVHGTNADRNFHYSLGVFNGDGQNFKNADNHFDWIGRGFVAPLSFAGPGPLHDVSLGGSFWTGDRGNTLAPAAQTTQGGFTFFNTAAFSATPPGATAAQSIQLRQAGPVHAFAVELNAPIAHRTSVRGELVWRHSRLAEASIASNGTGTVLGGADLRGYSLYGQIGVWVVGDDRIVGDQQAVGGLTRWKQFGVRPIENGLELLLRYEHLDEHLTEDTATAAMNLGNKSVGSTRVDALALGINYWHSRRYRATFNYVYNHFGGDAPYVTALASRSEQEFLARLAIAF